MSSVATVLDTLQCITTFGDPYSGKRVAELPEAIDEDLFDDQPEKQLMVQDCLQQLFPVVYRLWPCSANIVLVIGGMLQSTD